MSNSGIAPAGTAGTGASPEPSPDALASLYNAPHRRRARAETAKAHIGPGERPQEIYTPVEIVRAILNVWPHIEFDPCSGPDSIVPANQKAYIPRRFTEGDKPRPYYGAIGDERDGLAERWPDYTYVNPPFGLLETWMRKCAREAGENNPHTEIMLLAPVRTHRRWWRDCACASDRICWLDPVKFIGYGSGFPAPLAMLYWGDCTATFAWAFECLGDVREF